MTQLIHFQQRLRQEIPTVVGNVDYEIFRTIIERISDLIELGKLDFYFVEQLVKEAMRARKKEAIKKGEAIKPMSQKELEGIKKVGMQALRCTIARIVTGEALRVFTVHLADSTLLQWFCLMDNFGGSIKVPTKSTLQRYEQMIPEKVLREVIKDLTLKASESSEEDSQALRLEKAISLNDYYVDTTVVKTNIHFPIDWRLLADAVCTVGKSMIWIRKSGIKNRMQSPELFIKQINRYGMAMSYSRRKKGSKKEQKRLLRLMKKVVKVVRKHAQKHRDLLKENWKEAGLKKGQVKHVLKRMDTILDQFPKAIKQAHDRIISENLVPSKDKLLSLYEPDTKVIVRGKAGAEVEFGNKLLIAEQKDGLILDWKLYRDTVPSDQESLKESLDRLKKRGSQLKPETVTGDRGFSSNQIETDLAERDMISHICPRNPMHLAEKLKEESFVFHQKRRAQTEGRIGIIKSCFLGSPFRNKGFDSREKGLAWRILAHNLWVLARLDQDQKKIPLLLAA
tara:strand:- start:406 stop:1935 length:1530 start_codon:yes stop_codon:yes gene_type:complete